MSCKIRVRNGFIKKKGVTKNPSTREIEQARALFYEFTGHQAEITEEYSIKWPDTALTVGKCDGILYTTTRDGKTERYIHEFKKSARPNLLASHDGKQLLLIGGKFRFTDRGIVDYE